MDGQIRGHDLGERWHLLETKIVVSAKYYYDEEDTEYLDRATGEPPSYRAPHQGGQRGEH
jgi:hypothetical protein